MRKCWVGIGVREYMIQYVHKCTEIIWTCEQKGFRVSACQTGILSVYESPPSVQKHMRVHSGGSACSNECEQVCWCPYVHLVTAVHHNSAQFLCAQPHNVPA